MARPCRPLASCAMHTDTRAIHLELPPHGCVASYTGQVHVLIHASPDLYNKQKWLVTRELAHMMQ